MGEVCMDFWLFRFLVVYSTGGNGPGNGTKGNEIIMPSMYILMTPTINCPEILTHIPYYNTKVTLVIITLKPGLSLSVKLIKSIW